MSDGDDQDARARCAAARRALKLHEIAAAYFREQLAGPAGARARQQLADRDVTAGRPSTSSAWVSPRFRATRCCSGCGTQGFADNLLLQSGLVVRRDSGEIVDRFRNRLMVPICRDTGSIIAFGGRAMDSDQVPEVSELAGNADLFERAGCFYGLNLVQVPDSGQRASRY